MHDLDLLSKSLAAILFQSVTLLCLVNTLVWEWLKLETPNQVCRHLLWRPWTSSIMHDLGLLSRSLVTILFPLVTLLCLVNTIVWEWLKLETPNRVWWHLLWRPWTSLIMHDIDLLSWSLVAILLPLVTLLCLVNTLVWEWLQLQTSNWVCIYLLTFSTLWATVVAVTIYTVRYCRRPGSPSNVFWISRPGEPLLSLVLLTNQRAGFTGSAG